MTETKKKAALEDISRGRLEALSDGVFAIVVTLLVLEIKVPHVIVDQRSTAAFRDSRGPLRQIKSRSSK